MYSQPWVSYHTCALQARLSMYVRHVDCWVYVIVAFCSSTSHSSAYGGTSKRYRPCPATTLFDGSERFHSSHVSQWEPLCYTRNFARKPLDGSLDFTRRRGNVTQPMELDRSEYHHALPWWTEQNWLRFFFVKMRWLLTPCTLQALIN